MTRLMLVAGFALLIACSDDTTPATDSGPADDVANIDGQVVDAKVFDGPAADQAGDQQIGDKGAVDQTTADAAAPGGWAIQFGGAKNNHLVGMGHDAQGNLIVAGIFWDTMTFGSTTLTAYDAKMKLYVAKLTPAGTFAWAKMIAAPSSVSGVKALALSVDGAGNSYVTGNNGGMASVAGTTLQKGTFVAKLDASGTFKWATQVVYSSSPMNWFGQYGLAGVAADGAGGCYVVGTLMGPMVFGPSTFSLTSGQHAFVAKLDASGSFKWVTPAKSGSGGGISQGKDIALAASGDLYLTGGLSGAVTFGTKTISSSGGKYESDLFVAKVSAAGAFAWASAGGLASDNDTPRSIGVDAAGNSYMVGHAEQNSATSAPTIKFGAKTAPAGAAGKQTLYVVKHDKSGAPVWVTASTPSGEDRASDIAVSSSGDSYVLGHSKQTAFGGVTLPAGAGRSFVVKLDPTGAAKWIAAPSTTKGDIAGSITLNGGGVSTFGGGLYDATTFGSKTLTPPPTNYLARVGASGKL